MAITTLSANAIGTLSGTNLPTGSVLQTLQANKTDRQTIQSTSFVNILTQAITPSATSSGILIMAYVTTSGYGHYDVKVTRNDANIDNASGTGVGIGDQVGSNRVRSAAHFYRVTNYLTGYNSDSPCIVLLDYPNTTSAITYKIKGATPNDNSSYAMNVNHQNQDGDNAWAGTTICSLTVQEIKG